MTGVGLAALGGGLSAFARVGALMQAAPLTGDRTMPMRVRGAAAVVFAVALAPTRPPVELAALPLVLPVEILVGLITGFAARLALASVEAGGQLLGVQMEIGFAAFFDQRLGEESLPTREIIAAFAGLAFLACGGLEAMIRAAAVLPAADLAGRSVLETLASLPERGADVILVAIRLAAPVAVAALVANLASALASRAAPGMNVFAITLSLVLVASALALVTTTPALVREVMQGARAAVDALARGVAR